MAIQASVLPWIKGDTIPGTTPRLKAEVVFGKPSKKCLGTGICKVLPHQTTNNCGCTSATVELRKADEHTLLMRFRREALCSKRLEQFTHDRFLVEESLPLPEFVKEGLELDAAFLLSGCYAVWQNDRFLVVSLSLV
jgi:hypothetical protein